MITLYSNNCPRCIILKKQLEDANIEFEVSKAFKEVVDAGFRTAPVLKVENEMMDFDNAVKYIIGRR